MELDGNSIIASIVVSGVGCVFFSYGRKMSRAPHVVAGIVMMVFPYFVSNVLAMFGIGALLCALLYMAVRVGY
ncbi:MAG TPA: hypothetical protein VIW29_09570 [Polyangiaceae bacterium]